MVLITVFYDGTCGLCHKAVQFLLSRDAGGDRFRYAPLQGSTASSILDDRIRGFDSMVVQTEKGELLTRGDAALCLGKAIGGGWRWLAMAGQLVPRPIRNLLYDSIAKRRFRWFGTVAETCPLLPPEQQAFFLE